MCSGVGGWRWGERGWLPERPTICVWLTLRCWHCGPRGPGWSHFLSVLVTSHMPRLCQVELLSLQVPGLPRKQKQQGEDSVKACVCVGWGELMYLQPWPFLLMLPPSA